MGIWNKIGTVLYPNSTDLNGGSPLTGVSNQSLLYDINPKLISANSDGKVFKMWFMGANNMYYAESNDFKSWTRQATALLGGITFGLAKVAKFGSTYYMYGVTNPAGVPTSIICYTSSDGVTFTLSGTVMSVGGVGAWDSSSVQYFKPFYFDGTTYYATYSGTKSGIGGAGIATSTSLTGVWTNASAPAINVGGLDSYQGKDGRFYVLSSVPVPGNGAGVGVSISSNPTTGWITGSAVLVPTQLNEGTANPGSEGLGVPSAVQGLNGYTYMMMSGTANSGLSGSPYTLMAAITSLPFEAALSNSGGMVSYSVSITPIASDNFKRANETPLSDGGNWSLPQAPYFQANLVSNLAVATNTGAGSFMLWNAAGIGNDQESEVVLGTNSGSSIWQVRAVVRNQGNNLYQFGLTNSSGSLTWQLAAIYNGTTVVTLQSGTLSAAPIGTDFKLLIGGSALFGYINGVLVTTAHDSTILTGKPSFQLYDATTPGNTGISSWAGGNAGVIPAYPELYSWLGVNVNSSHCGLKH